MLTKTDLNQIGKVVDERLDERLEPIKKDLTGLKTDVSGLRLDVDGLKKDIKYLKKKTNRINKTVDLIVANYDEADVKLERRVRKIEQHLTLP